MTLRELLLVLVRRWWLIVLVPVVIAPLLFAKSRVEPYRSTLSASVLLPGDTEIPGNSERPELMVMDDLPSLIGSQVFAESVADALKASGSSLTADDVHGKISGSRYSRIVTITVTGKNKGDISAIASAAAAVLPGVVNRYLVADGATPATVQIIDQPSAPSRARPNQRLIFAALLVLGAVVGAGLALLANAWSAEARRESGSSLAKMRGTD
jgi:capsular polysaccharide biosynthesis protein